MNLSAPNKETKDSAWAHLSREGEPAVLVNVPGNRMILCPYHDEKTPSCVVDLKEGRFVCFGCRSKGSAKVRK